MVVNGTCLGNRSRNTFSKKGIFQKRGEYVMIAKGCEKDKLVSRYLTHSWATHPAKNDAGSGLEG